ncbi:hypothetical protein [Halomonas salinarum]|uniref:hypothetical protein n=1 Tax=Halomonas salinarum TaxID=1158993 RepID=UPI001438E2CB|nr:hypothetical protein [Halomonas salinarum]
MIEDALSKGAWVIGGAMLLGFGVVLFFREHTGLASLGALMTGLGAGLLLTDMKSGGSD